jgi:beta-phosphoglucomutase
MIGALLCEVEGVLANTESLRSAALRRALAEDGITLTESCLVPDGCLRTPDGLRRALRDHGVARDETAIALIAHRAHRHFAAMVPAGISLAPGARELIERAAARWRLAIVTDMERASVEYVTAQAGLESVFEVVIAAEDVAAEKPAPDGYRKALARMSRRRPLNIEHVVALEHGISGVAAAHAAGLRCIVIASGSAGCAAGTDAVLPSLEGHTPASLEALFTLESVA